jgi:hypothetical protein
VAYCHLSSYEHSSSKASIWEDAVLRRLVTSNVYCRAPGNHIVQHFWNRRCDHQIRRWSPSWAYGHVLGRMGMLH